jgi:hypothetical protein
LNPSYITFLSNVEGNLLPFQESRIANRENTHSLVTSPLIQTKFKSFPGIVEIYLMAFANVAFYKTRLVLLSLTPKGPETIFKPFLKFGQAIVKAIFIKNS